MALPADSMTATAAPVRSPADRRMRRLLRLPDDAPPVSLLAAQSAFSRSILISGTRCFVTYLLLPLLGPVVGISGTAGPVIGIVLGFISMAAITIATRRFFAADHRWRWAYASVGGAIFVGMIVSVAFDATRLIT
jgi:hypothetical protein